MFSNERRQIVVRLAEPHDSHWREFASKNNEIFINKRGRPIVPKLIYHIEGLDPNRRYKISLKFHLVDDNRYRFSNGRWSSIGRGEVSCAKANKTAKRVDNNCIVFTERRHSTVAAVNFDHVRITNNKVVKNRSHVYLHPMRKYVPVLSIYESEDLFTMPKLEPVAVRKIEYTEFITVTKLYNKIVSMLDSLGKYSSNKINSKNNDITIKRNQVFMPPEILSQSKRKKLDMAKARQFCCSLPTMLRPPYFTPKTFASINNEYHPKLEAANNECCGSLSPPEDPIQPVEENIEVKTTKDLPVDNDIRFPTILSSPHCTLNTFIQTDESYYPQPEVANNERSGSFSSPEDPSQSEGEELVIPMTKELAADDALLPTILSSPHCTPNTLLQADKSCLPQLEAVMENMATKELPNTILSFEFLKLAFLDALISSVGIFPPGTDINHILSSLSSPTHSDKNVDLNP